MLLLKINWATPFVANIKVAVNATYGLIPELSYKMYHHLDFNNVFKAPVETDPVMCYFTLGACDCLKDIGPTFSFSPDMTLGFFASLHVQQMSLK